MIEAARAVLKEECFNGGVYKWHKDDYRSWNHCQHYSRHLMAYGANWDNCHNPRDS